LENAQDSGDLEKLCVQNLNSSFNLESLDEQTKNNIESNKDIQSFSWLDAGQWLMIGMVKGAWSAMAYLTSTELQPVVPEGKVEPDSKEKDVKHNKEVEKVEEGKEENDKEEDKGEEDNGGTSTEEDSSETESDTESTGSDDDENEEEDEEEEDKEDEESEDTEEEDKEEEEKVEEKVEEKLEEKVEEKVEVKVEDKPVEEGQKPEVTENIARPEEFDLEFVRTNWLWRHQIRIFRFKDTTFERIEPSNNSVRAVFEYNNVCELEQVDEKSIIIKFKDRVAEDQYLSTDAKENISKATATIGARVSNGTQITIKIPTKIINEVGAPQ